MSALAEGGGAAAPKRISAAIRGYPTTLSISTDSAGAGSTAGIREVSQLLNSGLGVADADGLLRPQLAEAVPTVENGLWKVLPDWRMETTWRLKPGVSWHDGAPFTSADFAFTATVARDRQVPITPEQAFDAVEAVDATDARTVVVRWKRPFINADALFSEVSANAVMPMPRHLVEQIYADDASGLTQLAYWSTEFVGTGPFKVREFFPDSYVAMTASDGYALGRPKIDEIEVRFFGDYTVMVATVLAGTIDLTLGRGLSLEQGMEAQERWASGHMQKTLTSINALFPQFLNPDPVVVADLSFRRALMHAMDRQQMSDVLQAGISPVADSPLLPSEPDARAADSRLVRYPFDPRRSSQLLDGLGYRRAGDGRLRDAAGQGLSVRIQTTQDDLREKLLPVIANYWRQVGVAVEPVVLSRQASNDRQLRSEFSAFDFTRQPTDPTRYHSTQAPTVENNYTGNDRGRYRSAELDGLIDRYLVTILWEERTGVMAQIAHHITDQLVIMGLFYIVEPALISNRLLNITERNTDRAIHTWNAHEWDVRS